MFKVIIIDDESFIRKGLKNIINWEKFECNFAGEAQNGIEGLELALREKPDIIITDIRMPGMDGLEMISKLKSSLPDAKVIILTGYRDFDYIHEALNLGAYGFLLKPSKIDELNEIITKAVRELKLIRNRSEEFDKLKNLVSKNMPVLRERFMYEMILYNMKRNIRDIEEKIKLFQIDISRFFLCVVEIDDDLSRFTQYDIHLYQFGIISVFKEVFECAPYIYDVVLNNEQIAFVVNEYKSSDLFESVVKKCEDILDIIKRCFPFTVTISISDMGNSLYELNSKYNICKKALGYKFFIGNNSLITYKDLSSFYKFEDSKILEKSKENLIEGIKTGNEALVKKELINIGESTKDFNITCVKNYYLEILNLISVMCSSFQNEEDGFTKEDFNIDELNKCNNIDELNKKFAESALEFASYINRHNRSSIKYVLKKAVEYIENHYNEQLTLSDVAGHVYISSYYLSRLFKKELGKNFVDYLNEKRIEKARIMLMDLKYKTYEVAEAVGINDAHYFSKLFKKYTGMTPTEFRETNSGS